MIFRYVIEVWERENNPLLYQLIELGYRVITVPKDIWYLDHGFWGQTIYSNWRKMYSYTFPTGDTILGGEVAMWGEYVDAQGLGMSIFYNVSLIFSPCLGRTWSKISQP